MNLRSNLEGKKTYLLSLVASIIIIIATFLKGDVTYGTAINEILELLGLWDASIGDLWFPAVAATLRAGMHTSGKNAVQALNTTITENAPKTRVRSK